MTDFTFDGCDGVTFQSSIRWLDAASLVHANYTPLATAQSSSLPEDARQAPLLADLYLCQEFTAGAYYFENVWFGVARIPVEAPSDAREADDHAYILQMIGGDDVLTAIWKVVKYPQHAGETNRTDYEGAAVLLVAGDYRFDVATTIPDQGADANSFTWYHELPGGDRLTWTGMKGIPAGVGGQASLAYPASSPFASAAPFEGAPFSGQGSAHTAAVFSGMNLVQEVAEFRD